VNSDYVMSSAISCCLKDGKCTKSITGVNMEQQPFYQCFTCWGTQITSVIIVVFAIFICLFTFCFLKTKGCCASCAQTCHIDQGHQV
jgi:hypothetical protein